MTTLFDDLTVGVEIETIGKTRLEVAGFIRSVTGGELNSFRWGSGMCWGVKDLLGREWRVLYDSSLNASQDLQAEVVTPILRYSDMPLIQDVVRALRHGGCQVDSSCAIHIHVGSAMVPVPAVCRLAKIVNKHEHMLYDALDVLGNRYHYCRPMESVFIERIEKDKPKTVADLNKAWYGNYSETRPLNHYDDSRYHGFNLHNYFSRGTIEFRYFNGTLHAGKVKSYIQLVLGMVVKAIDSKAASSAKKSTSEESGRYDFRTFLLRIGFIGDEFKTARGHLLAKFKGDSAFKYGRPTR